MLRLRGRDGALSRVVAQAFLKFPDPKFLAGAAFCDVWFELFPKYMAREAQVEASVGGNIFVESFADRAEWWQISI